MYAGIVTVTILLLLGGIILLFPDPFLNAFARGPIEKAFAKAYPGYSIELGYVHYSVWQNLLECDSLVLYSKDTTTSGSMTALAIGGVAWFNVLRDREISLSALAEATLEAHGIAMHFLPSHNEIRFERLQVRIADSTVALESVNIFSSLEQEQFFAGSPIRQTWFRTDLPSVRLERCDFQALFQGNSYDLGTIIVEDMFTEILVNMDRPYVPGPTPPQMPNEALLSIGKKLSVDTIRVINARLEYGERVTARGKPGVISFKDINVSITGVSNYTDPPDTAIVLADGLFMNAAPMTLFMSIPLSSPDFSLRYSGSLGAMQASALNVFLEPCEHVRVTSGNLRSATYEIAVDAGRARGSLKIIYDHLRISVLDKKTGSARGILDRLASLFGRIFIIHGSNERDSDGVLALGKIRLRRATEDYFLQYLWFALRSGVADIVGF
jgi:hypothetical protein